MTHFEALVFDLDGTLWDTSRPVAEAWNSAIKKASPGSHPVTTEEVISIMGMPFEDAIRKIFQKRGLPDSNALAEKMGAAELERLKDEGAPLYPGVRQGMVKLAERFPLYLVSNCEESYLQIFLKASGFSSLFKDVECHGRTGLSKADNLHDIIRRNQMKNGAYIGDTASDQAAAEAAGLAYFHASYGFGRPARHCIEFRSFPELTKFFLE